MLVTPIIGEILQIESQAEPWLSISMGFLSPRT